MKSFLKTVLAVFCALFLVQVVGTLFFFAALGNALSSGEKPVLPRKGVLDLDFSSVTLGEQPRDRVMDGLSSGKWGKTSVIGLWEAQQALKAAAADPGVSYVLLRPDAVSLDLGQLEELRASLLAFRLSGKPVIAYTEAPGNASYYLASAADKIYMPSHEGVFCALWGFSGQMVFFKDVLDKLGIRFQLVRHGKYKSAGETFTRSSASPENRLQHQALVDSFWDKFSTDMATSRDIAPATFRSWVDHLQLDSPQSLLDRGLVDELLDHDALLEKLRLFAEAPGPEAFHLISFADYVKAKAVTAVGRKPKIAVLFAEGEIVDMPVGTDQQSCIVGDEFVREIEALRDDASVQAVVLRVNSPGGAVLASSKIRSALDSLAAVKPLVTSMGGMAASGGYWISCGAGRVFSDATTLTGSIGVFAMIPEFSGTLRKVGIGVEHVRAGRHSDIFGGVRTFDAEEQACVQTFVDKTYEQFVSLVSESRGLSLGKVHEIAQGRVWAGADALELGLVDELGGLREAVAWAAAQGGYAGEEDYVVQRYPRVRSWMEELIQEAMGLATPAVWEDLPFSGVLRELSALEKSGKRGAGAAGSVGYARLPLCMEFN